MSGTGTLSGFWSGYREREGRGRSRETFPGFKGDPMVFSSARGCRRGKKKKKAEQASERVSEGGSSAEIIRSL